MSRTATARDWLQRHQRALVLALVTLMAYVAAINRGNTLAWGVAALLLSTLITGFAWPYWLVCRLSVVRTGPERASEGETLLWRMQVHNRGWMPRFMVELTDRLPFVGAAGGNPAPGPVVLGQLAYLPAGASCQLDFQLPCEKRGRYRLGPAGLAASFPLGLAEARHEGGGDVRTLLVYPRVFPIVTLPLRGSPSLINRGGLPLPDGTGSADFAGLREYRRGDNPRHVHWPTSARLNELMIREFEPLASAALCLALDLSPGANVGLGREASGEYAIRIAASIARYACEQAMPIRLEAAGRDAAVLSIPAGNGELHYRELLEFLAVAELASPCPYARVLERVAQQCQPGETVVALLAPPPAEAADVLRALALARSQGAHLLAVLLERQSFAAGAEPLSEVLTAGLLDLGAQVLTVRQGDDLVQVFNP